MKSVLSTQKTGALIRLFSAKPEHVESNVKGAMALIRRLQEARVEGLPAFNETLVVIFGDKRYGDRADCGATEEPLRDALRVVGLESKVRVENVEYGDLNWGLLNHGFSRLHRMGCDIIASISPQSVGLCTDENLANVVKAFADGAKASCLAVYDIDGVSQGCFTNASTWWDANALAGVGMFDEVASMPIDPHRANWKYGRHPQIGDLWYLCQGVEEIAPLIRITERYKECLAPIVPRSALEKGIAYDLPDRAQFPDLWERKLRQLVTKRVRQNSVAESVNRNLTTLKYGIMPQYRISPYWEQPVTLEVNVPL